MKTIKGLAMHVHHDVLFEYCYDYDERVQAIKDTKPKNEQPARLKLFKMLSKEAINELPRRIMKVLSELEKARSEWNKARSEWNKAYSEWNKAYSEWNKACSELNKALSEWNKAYSEWNKARSEWNKAYSEWNKARSEWDGREAWHKKHCGCKEWNGEEIVFNNE